MTVRLLVTGHLTGPQALADVIAALPRLRSNHRLDAVAVIADNPSITGPAPMGGSGMTVADRNRLLDAGVELLLTGSHVWDGGHGQAAVAHPQVLRSANLTGPAVPGQGRATLRAGGTPLTVLQLTDPSARGAQASDLATGWRAHREDPPDLVHVVAPGYQVQVFAHAVDGQVAAVVGSLSHIASRDLVRLPRGTVLVPDVGYVGPPGGIGGFEPSHFLTAYTGVPAADLPPYRHTAGPTQFSGVILELVGPPGSRSRVRGMSWLLNLR
jgi:2',3'-cyclic-nucleotide 2'-phosphodiesterase